MHCRPFGFIVASFALALATVAGASTEQQLVVSGEQLVAQYEALEVEIAACPDGECAEARDLVDQLDALDASLALLHLLRSMLPPGCGCGELDAVLAEADALSASLRSTVGPWDEVS